MTLASGFDPSQKEHQEDILLFHKIPFYFFKKKPKVFKNII